MIGGSSPEGAGNFSIHHRVLRPALGHTQPPVKWVSGALTLVVNRLGCEAGHSPPPSAEVKNVWNYTSTPLIRLNGVVLS
jgi:hypothetical protein